MKVSSQKANELGLDISKLIGYKTIEVNMPYCPGGGYTTNHLKSELIKKINEEYDDSLILVNFSYSFYERTNIGGYYNIIGSGDVYKL